VEARDLALHENVKRATVAALLAAAVALGFVDVPRASAAAPRMTLEASRYQVTYGGAVVLSGRVRGAGAGERVALLSRGRVRRRATTDGNGRFAARIRPARRITLRARWNGETSRRVRVRVRALVRTRLRPKVRLFGEARVKGIVRPAHDGATVTVRLYRNGRSSRTKRVALQGRRFKARFNVRRPGSYKARATFDDADHLPGRDASARRRARLPRLSRGARDVHVELLERRLRKLNYLIRRVNRRFDYRTADAITAFHKVQGMPRTGNVGEATWRALASPKRPRPRASSRRVHIEIDQTKQVLYVVRRGRITRVLHTSTGGGGAITRDGVWRVHRKIAGYSPGRLYYPSYFDGLRAIHGWRDVPATPASHGCARVPMWTAKWIFRRADVGTVVRIYH
jgi:N-acetylmuramoyl-L-alanine amidase